MIDKLNIKVSEDTSSVRINSIGWIDPKRMKSSSSQQKPYYSLNCMVNEVSKNLGISAEEIYKTDDLIKNINKKWGSHFNKLLKIYLHNRIGMILLQHHQHIFYNTKKAPNRIYPFCNYPVPQVRIVNNDYGYSEYGGIEVINEFDKIIYIFLNNKKDLQLKYLEGEFLEKYNGFLSEIESYISEKDVEVEFSDKDQKNHNYTVKFVKYNSNFYDKTNYYGPDDKKYIEEYIGLNEIEKRIGYKSRIDPNHQGDYYFYECEECLDSINRHCKTCRSKKYVTNYFPLEFDGNLIKN
jgi:hypothetical protein